MYRDDLKHGKQGCREFVKTMTDAELETLIQDARNLAVPFEDYTRCLVGYRMHRPTFNLVAHRAEYLTEWSAIDGPDQPLSVSAAYRLLGLIERPKALITESDILRQYRILWIALAERNRHRPQRILAQVREVREIKALYRMMDNFANAQLDMAELPLSPPGVPR